jgi:hypothetical protein
MSVNAPGFATYAGFVSPSAAEGFSRASTIMCLPYPSRMHPTVLCSATIGRRDWASGSSFR